MFLVEKDVSELSSLIEKAESNIIEKEEKQSKFISLKDHISKWLSAHEAIISELDVVAVSTISVIQQIEQLNVRIISLYINI